VCCRYHSPWLLCENYGEAVLRQIAEEMNQLELNCLGVPIRIDLLFSSSPELFTEAEDHRIGWNPREILFRNAMRRLHQRQQQEALAQLDAHTTPADTLAETKLVESEPRPTTFLCDTCANHLLALHDDSGSLRCRRFNFTTPRVDCESYEHDPTRRSRRIQWHRRS